MVMESVPGSSPDSGVSHPASLCFSELGMNTYSSIRGASEGRQTTWAQGLVQGDAQKG